MLSDSDLPRAWWEGRPGGDLPVAPRGDDSDLPGAPSAAWTPGHVARWTARLNRRRFDRAARLYAATQRAA